MTETGDVERPPVPRKPPPTPKKKPPTPHKRHNHDNRRYGTTSTSYSESEGADTSSESVSIPDSLIEQQEAAESDNEEYPVVQEVTPPRPLGL